MEQALGRLFTLAGLAILGGVGVLAWQVGETWTSSDTQALITAFAMVCGGGAVLIAVLVAMVLGVPMAIRYFGEAGRARQSWGDAPVPMRGMSPVTRQLGGYDPPMLTASKDDAGTWQSGGPSAYDLWDEEEQTVWDEPTAATPASNRRGRLI